MRTIILLIVICLLSCKEQTYSEIEKAKEVEQMTKWEMLEKTDYSATMKMEVPGGWIVCHKWRGYDCMAVGMVFVADEKHSWR